MNVVDNYLVHLSCLLLLIADRLGATALVTAVNLSPCTSPSLFIPDVAKRPHQVIIAHRGASFYFPEHSIPAYRLALELGVDYIEPDLVATSDGVLVALHSLDLNITTNVDEVYSVLSSNSSSNKTDRTWYSPYAKQRSYWVYNFTYAELQRLTLRQRLPNARTTAYDDMFKLPTLTEILELIVDWNSKRLPKLVDDKSNVQSSGNQGEEDADNVSNNNISQQSMSVLMRQAGMYPEFKDSDRLLEEAGIDLVSLFYKHMQDYKYLWQDLLMPSCEKSHQLRYDEYLIPPLVLQSFQVETLRRVSKTWANISTQLSKSQDLNSVGNTNSTPGVTLSPPLPPLVLLIDSSICQSQEFWFSVGEDYRYFIDGIGCEKSCVYTTNKVNTNTLTLEKAHEMQVALHTWTTRPEPEYYLSGVDNVQEEIEYLVCQARVQGIFTEDIETAQLVVHQGCPNSKLHSDNNNNNNNNNTSAKANNPADCDSGYYFVSALGFFVIGGTVTGSIIIIMMNKRQQLRYGAANTASDDVHEIELEIT